MATTAAGLALYKRGGSGGSPHDEEGEIVSVSDADAGAAKEDDADTVPKETQTWKESSGRTEGRDGYVFGDLTRGVVRGVFGRKATPSELEEEAEAEAAGDSQYGQIQTMVDQMVRLFRARGYSGTINLSQNVAYFSETCSVRVDPPDVPPWERDGASANVAAAASDAALVQSGKAGRVFCTLLNRLQRRAAAWQALSHDAGLDPSLTAAAQIGFAVPVIKLGWGVSVSLTVTTSSLLRWAEYSILLPPLEAKANDSNEPKPVAPLA